MTILSTVCCDAWGDPHYKTFDDSYYEFQGDCEYVLATDKCGTVGGNFRVTVGNVPCGSENLACTKSVKFEFGYTTIFLVRGQDPVVSNSPSSGAIRKKVNFDIEDSTGIFLTIKTDIGER